MRFLPGLWVASLAMLVFAVLEGPLGDLAAFVAAFVLEVVILVGLYWGGGRGAE